MCKTEKKKYTFNLALLIMILCILGFYIIGIKKNT